jgi:uncharacterized protein YdaU (DUF1376 family)
VANSPSSHKRKQSPTPRRRLADKAPAFQFYPKDLLSDANVSVMDNQELGVYMRLMAHCWIERSLPGDMVRLAKLARETPDTFSTIWITVGMCFERREDENGIRFFHPRLEKERKKQAAFRDKATKRGHLGAEARWSNKHASSIKQASTKHASSMLSDGSPISYLQSSSSTPVEKKENAPLDLAFQSFQDAYPASRRKGGWNVQTAFIDQVGKAGSAEALMAALANHKASEQWQKASLIPSMDKWLAEERWRQRLDPPGAAPATGSLRTAGNAAALQRFIDRGIA